MNIRNAVANWWLTNARIKWGHPPEVAATNETVAAPDATPAQVPSSSSWPWGLVLASLLAGTTGGVAIPAVYGWLTSDTQQQQATSDPTSNESGSLYQYLEDHGYHLDQ